VASEPDVAVRDGAGPAVLDIGSDIGAAVVYATAALEGTEIEIRHRPDEWNGVHTVVRRRARVDPEAPLVYAALFDRLAAGSYDLRVRDRPGCRVHPLEVVGGQVAATTMPDGMASRSRD
jgi:hypothetical protein